MEKYGQISITIGALGIMLTLIGLFPGIVGLEVTQGIGVLQVLVILLGFAVLFAAAHLYVKITYYAGQPSTLAQSIGLRLTLTGLLVAAAAGLADVLGFGTHTSTTNTRPFLGAWQAVGFVGGILIASAGVLVYAAFGPPPEPPPGDAPGGDQRDRTTTDR